MRPDARPFTVTAPRRPKRTNRGRFHDRPVEVPPWLLAHRGELSQGAMLLYGLLGQYEAKGTIVTYAELAERLKGSRTWVRYQMAELRRMTLIQVERTGKGNIYRATKHLWMYSL